MGYLPLLYKLGEREESMGGLTSGSMTVGEGDRRRSREWDGQRSWSLVCGAKWVMLEGLEAILQLGIMVADVRATQDDPPVGRRHRVVVMRHGRWPVDKRGRASRGDEKGGGVVG